MTDTNIDKAFEDSESDAPSLPQANGYNIVQAHPNDDIARINEQHTEDAQEDDNEVIIGEDVKKTEGDGQSEEENADDDNSSDEGEFDGHSAEPNTNHM